jgi:hypothetical protein
VGDLPELLFSWEKHLRAEGKSKATVKAYGDGIRSYVKWSEHADVSGLAIFTTELPKDKPDTQSGWNFRTNGRAGRPRPLARPGSPGPSPSSHPGPPWRPVPM